MLKGTLLVKLSRTRCANVHYRFSSSYMSQMAWAVATGPLKSVPQNLFMMWMMGSSISIFTIGFLVYMLYGPVKALLSVNTGTDPRSMLVIHAANCCCQLSQI